MAPNLWDTVCLTELTTTIRIQSNLIYSLRETVGTKIEIRSATASADISNKIS
jgi:hypothetical protein